MKCTCNVDTGICSDCGSALAMTQDCDLFLRACGAKRYATLGRVQRLCLGEHYARPMPALEYLYKLLHESEEV